MNIFIRRVAPSVWIVSLHFSLWLRASDCFTSDELSVIKTTPFGMKEITLCYLLVDLWLVDEHIEVVQRFGLDGRDEINNCAIACIQFALLKFINWAWSPVKKWDNVDITNDLHSSLFRDLITKSSFSSAFPLHWQLRGKGGAFFDLEELKETRKDVRFADDRKYLWIHLILKYGEEIPIRV